MKKQTSFITLSLMLVTPAMAGGAGGPAMTAPAAACKSIAQIVMSDPNFSTLATAVEAAGLSQTLMGGNYTVFAPSNAAFAKLPSDTLAAALNDPALLRALLTYHVVPGKVSAKQVMTLSTARTVQGGSLLISASGGKVMVDNATVTRTDIAACNGIIHVIDTVLMPAMAAAPAQPAATVTAPAPAPTATAPATTTAPAATDIMAIPALPVGVTTAPATTTTTTETTTTTDTTVTTDTTTETTATADTTADMTEGTTLYDVIGTDERFSTLRDLLSDAELTEVLISNDYTIFAPTNEAFEALDPDTLALIASNPDTLKAVLLYHVVSGKVTGEQLGQATQLRSEQGASLNFKLDGTTQMVNEATVTVTPVEASNGYIYAVDQVLLPPDLVLPTAPADTTGTSTTDTTTATTTTTTATTTTTTATTTVTLASAQSGATLMEVLSQPQFSTLLSLVQKANLMGALTAGDVTLFAPTNDAFAKLPQTTLDALMASPDQLKQVLLFHVVTGRVVDAGLNVAQLRSMEGSSIDLTTNGSTYRVGVLKAGAITGGTINTRADAGNSVVYPIDTVLLPPTLK
ncbi:fasciclin domain-containing protein [Deinococcus taeanensis]|uniref:fasciclin domain-containing protein n=1 Tax=Deinococcus taeanensis TaxID=2737050 RepID=UPI001CDC8EEF|nr:fasciclin domain-containing protein [Deinococcus taeanensis]UBV41458.1 fasciclin domain-containing protein [Deinococcus taeanensis]